MDTHTQPEAEARNINLRELYALLFAEWEARRLPLTVSGVVTRTLEAVKAFSADKEALQRFYQPEFLRAEEVEALPEMVQALLELDAEVAHADSKDLAPREEARALKAEVVRHLRYVFVADAEVQVILTQASRMQDNRSLAASMLRVAALCEARWTRLQANSGMTEAALTRLRALARVRLDWDESAGEEARLADLRSRAATRIYDGLARIQRLARFAFREDPERRAAYPRLRPSRKPRRIAPVAPTLGAEAAAEGSGALEP